MFEVPEGTIKGSVTYREIRLKVFDYVLDKAGSSGNVVDKRDIQHTTSIIPQSFCLFHPS